MWKCGFVTMEYFFIDRLANEDFGEVYETTTEIQDNGGHKTDDFLNCDIDLFDEVPNNLSSKEIKSKTRDEICLDNTYLITSYKNLNEEKKSFSHADKLMEKSVINKGFEKHLVVPAEKSKKVLKLKRKKLQEKTKGKNWFDMPATEITEEIKTDFELLKMRSVLDRKHLYKKNDITHMPKYFQVGKVIESSADFYGSRIPKSLRKKTMVDELLADAEFKNYQKKKFKEIMNENRRKKQTNKNLKENKSQKKGRKKR